MSEKSNVTEPEVLGNETENVNAHKHLTLKRKRVIAAISIVISVALFLWLGYYLTDAILMSLDSDEGIASAAQNFKEMITSYGNLGWIVAFGIQVLQVVVSPIPGEVVEVGMGLCFGWFGGALLCLLGVSLASWLVLLFVKKLGIKVVELFVSLDKLNDLKFINDDKKLNRFAFLLYLIPGTPKDPLIFFFGLTRMNISTFIVISTIARIPSVVTSTIGGDFIVKQNYLGAILMFAITGAVSVIGILAYGKIISRLKERSKNKKQMKPKD